MLRNKHQRKFDDYLAQQAKYDLSILKAIKKLKRLHDNLVRSFEDEAVVSSLLSLKALLDPLKAARPSDEASLKLITNIVPWLMKNKKALAQSRHLLREIKAKQDLTTDVQHELDTLFRFDLKKNDKRRDRNYIKQKKNRLGIADADIFKYKYLFLSSTEESEKEILTKIDPAEVDSSKEFKRFIKGIEKLSEDSLNQLVLRHEEISKEDPNLAQQFPLPDTANLTEDQYKIKRKLERTLQRQAEALKHLIDYTVSEKNAHANDNDKHKLSVNKLNQLIVKLVYDNHKRDNSNDQTSAENNSDNIKRHLQLIIDSMMDHEIDKHGITLLSHLKIAYEEVLKYQQALDALTHTEVFPLKPSMAILNSDDLQKLYETAKNHKPYEVINYVYDLTFSQGLDNTLKSIHDSIKALQKDTLIPYGTKNIKFLIKYQNRSDLNPIHPNENKIQVLRYLQGMVNIVDSVSDRKIQNELKTGIKIAYDTYLQKTHEHVGSISDQDVEALINSFAELLVKQFNLKTHEDGVRQVRMARELAILLEKHPALCTITEHEDFVTIEQSVPAKIRPQYYQNKLKDLNDAGWLRRTKIYAGFSNRNPDLWIENFLRKNKERIISLGVPSPAGWFPVPAKTQEVENIIIKKDKNGLVINNGHLETLNTAKFIRVALVKPYALNKKSLQKQLNVQQLKETIDTRLLDNISRFKSLYDGYLDDHFDFLVSQQTFLSPVRAEVYLPQASNDAKLLSASRDAYKALSNAPEYQHSIDGAQISFSHTNAAINQRATWRSVQISGLNIKMPSWLTVKLFQADKIERLQKINLTVRMLKKILGIQLNLNKATPAEIEEIAQRLQSGNYGNIRVELQHELALRLRAAYALQKLLNNEPPFKGLHRYQRGLMISALELHTLGSQTMTLASCRNAKDHTAIFAAAVKAMQENPSTMFSWDELNRGVVYALEEGHHFRSLLIHSGLVNLGKVHPLYKKQLIENIKAHEEQIHEEQINEENSTEEFTSPKMTSAQNDTSYHRTETNAASTIRQAPSANLKSEPPEQIVDKTRSFMQSVEKEVTQSMNELHQMQSNEKPTSNINMQQIVMRLEGILEHLQRLNKSLESLLQPADLKKHSTQSFLNTHSNSLRKASTTFASKNKGDKTQIK